MSTAPNPVAPGAEPDQDFLNATAHVPAEVRDDHAQEFAGVNAPAPAAIGAIAAEGWTEFEIAALFNGLFTLLILSRAFVPIGGEHWNIPADKVQHLARAWLPIFIKHVPWEKGDKSWLPELLMWLGAIGALKTVCGDAIRIEIANLRSERLKAIQRQRSTTAGSTTENTETAMSPGSSSSPASGSQERPPSNGESLDSLVIEG